MKTSKQNIQDLLSQLATDIEEIKEMLNSGSAGVGRSNAISNDRAVGNLAATDFAIVGNRADSSNPDRIIVEINRLLEPIVHTCGNLPGRLKSYHAQLLQHIYQHLHEELTRDIDTRKRNGLTTMEDKIDNSLTMLVSIYDQLNQLEDALLPDTLRQGQARQIQSANGKSEKSGIIARLQSVWSSVQRLWARRPMRRHRNPYILYAMGIYLLYFVLSIFSWQQWHHYRDENIRLRLAADKYCVDSIIRREVYPQAAITLSVYEHITESEGTDAALDVFWNKVQESDSKHKSKSKLNNNE